jgi:hypothetical protein
MDGRVGVGVKVVVAVLVGSVVLVGRKVFIIVPVSVGLIILAGLQALIRKIKIMSVAMG